MGSQTIQSHLGTNLALKSSRRFPGVGSAGPKERKTSAMQMAPGAIDGNQHACKIVDLRREIFKHPVGNQTNCGYVLFLSFFWQLNKA